MSDKRFRVSSNKRTAAFLALLGGFIGSLIIESKVTDIDANLIPCMVIAILIGVVASILCAVLGIILGLIILWFMNAEHAGEGMAAILTNFFKFMYKTIIPNHI